MRVRVAVAVGVAVGVPVTVRVAVTVEVFVMDGVPVAVGLESVDDIRADLARGLA